MPTRSDYPTERTTSGKGSVRVNSFGVKTATEIQDFLFIDILATTEGYLTRFVVLEASILDRHHEVA